MHLLDRAETRRIASLASLDPTEQSARGQYFTPVQAAQIIAGLPRVPTGDSIRILDPGAGSGILTAAIVERIRAERPDVPLEIVAVEMDAVLHPTLGETLSDIENLGGVRTALVDADFLPWALTTDQGFDLVIQNPPYAKLQAGTASRNLMRGAGIDVPNSYAAFLALGLRLLHADGQQVAITPRSWMNGTYYSAFRRELVATAGIDAIHTFESRSKVFGDTGVLQETIVVSMTRSAAPKVVQVFTSHDHRQGVTSRTVPYSDVVTRDFIHVPATEKHAEAVAWMALHAAHSLADLGLTVSTGRVVDFRSREMLHVERVSGAVPMVAATHIRAGETHHPVGAKKPEWFHSDPTVSAKLLVPAGAYVVIKRFSAKEERRRVSAGVWSSNEPAAFDNKVNFVHQSGHGLDLDVAAGLSIYLNSTRFDDFFRVFSGHTQVNASDLRKMHFPSLAQLRRLASTDARDQGAIDAAVEAILAPASAAA